MASTAAPTAGASAAVDPRAEDLARWFTDKHVGFTSALECRDVPGAGRGMFATRNVEALKTQGGDPILDIPASALLNPLTILASPRNTLPAHLFPLTTAALTARSSGTGKAASAAPVPRGAPKAPSNGVVKRKRLSAAPRLNATQVMVLHLVLTRDARARHPSDWEVYIRTLPEFEGWHPLTWLYAGGARAGAVGESAEDDAGAGNTDGQEETHAWDRGLLGCLTPSARAKLVEVQERYELDRAAVRHVLRAEDPFRTQNVLADLTEQDMLWAWLNVNTRSVSIPLGYPTSGPHTQNHSLVPMLDMLNHSSSPLRSLPAPQQIPSSSVLCAPTPAARRAAAASASASAYANGGGGLGRPHLVPGRVSLRLRAPPRGMEAGEEALFQYGPHSSATLFAEYGFSELVHGDGDEVGWKGLQHGQLDLGTGLEEVWAELDEAEREDKEDVLRSIGCLGKSVIHTSPAPPHPSHALLMTLRILHLPAPLDSDKVRSIRSGVVSYISPANEELALESLRKLCERAVAGAEVGMERLDPVVDDVVKRGALRALWLEERGIARAILGSLDRGELEW